MFRQRIIKSSFEYKMKVVLGVPFWNLDYIYVVSTTLSVQNYGAMLESLAFKACAMIHINFKAMDKLLLLSTTKHVVYKILRSLNY